MSAIANYNAKFKIYIIIHRFYYAVHSCGGSGKFFIFSKRSGSVVECLT